MCATRYEPVGRCTGERLADTPLKVDLHLWRERELGDEGPVVLLRIGDVFCCRHEGLEAADECMSECMSEAVAICEVCKAR